jgi:hypothetical protein
MGLTRFTRGFLAPCVCALALFISTSARADDDQISEEAKLYFRNGVELIQSQPPNYQDAYYQFKLAYDKSHSWKVLGNLGLCALKLERDGEAIQFYKEYLDRGGKDIDTEERAQLERDLLLVNGNTATVKLKSTVPDVEITDSRAGTNVPPQGYKFQGDSLELRLRGGTHTLTATAPDGKTVRWEVGLSPGKDAEHTFDFSKPPEPPPGEAGQPGGQTGEPVPAAEHTSGLRTAGFVVVGVGGVALIGGVVTGLLAKGKSSDATDQCLNKYCPASSESDFDSAQSLATVTNVLLIGGGVLAAAGVGMIIAGGSSSEKTALAAPPPRLKLVPAVSSQGGGVWATGSF